MSFDARTFFRPGQIWSSKGGEKVCVKSVNNGITVRYVFLDAWDSLTVWETDYELDLGVFCRYYNILVYDPHYIEDWIELL